MPHRNDAAEAASETPTVVNALPVDSALRSALQKQRTRRARIDTAQRQHPRSTRLVEVGFAIALLLVPIVIVLAESTYAPTTGAHLGAWVIACLAAHAAER